MSPAHNGLKLSLVSKGLSLCRLLEGQAQHPDGIRTPWSTTGAAEKGRLTGNAGCTPQSSQDQSQVQALLTLMAFL